MPVIALSNVSKIYHLNAVATHALNNISLTINSGEMVAIMGASGSGKSTLLNILGLLDRPSQGEYILSGQPVAHLLDDEQAYVRNLKIGFVFQSFFLLPRLTALQNIMLPLIYRDTEKTHARDQALAMLKKLNIMHLAERKPLQLSGGQQQRIALARALIGHPEVILADEPTGSLDSYTSQEVMDLFLALHQKERKTIIIVTHDYHIAHQCERIIHVQDGGIQGDHTKAGQ